jgi:hypothetical protein
MRSGDFDQDGRAGVQERYRSDTMRQGRVAGNATITIGRSAHVYIVVLH